MKKLVYVVVLALGLMAVAAADGPWPPDCFPHCTPPPHPPTGTFR